MTLIPGLEAEARQGSVVRPCLKERERREEKKKATPSTMEEEFQGTATVMLEKFMFH